MSKSKNASKNRLIIDKNIQYKMLEYTNFGARLPRKLHTSYPYKRWPRLDIPILPPITIALPYATFSISEPDSNRYLSLYLPT